MEASIDFINKVVYINEVNGFPFPVYTDHEYANVRVFRNDDNYIVEGYRKSYFYVYNYISKEQLIKNYPDHIILNIQSKDVPAKSYLFGLIKIKGYNYVTEGVYEKISKNKSVYELKGFSIVK